MPYDSAHPLMIEHVAYEGIGKLVEEGKYDITEVLINLKSSYEGCQHPEKSARLVANNSYILLEKEFGKNPFLGVKNLCSGESLPFIDETFSVITENGKELEKNYFDGIERLYKYKGNRFLTVEKHCHGSISDWKNVFIKVSDNQAQPSLAQESLNPDVFAYEAIGKYELSKGKTYLFWGLKELKENILKNRVEIKTPSKLVVQKNIDGKQYVGFSNLSFKSRCGLIRNGIKNLEENDKGYADKSGIKYVAKTDAFLLIRNSLTKEREVFIEIPNGKLEQKTL